MPRGPAAFLLRGRGSFLGRCRPSDRRACLQSRSPAACFPPDDLESYQPHARTFLEVDRKPSQAAGQRLGAKGSRAVGWRVTLESVWDAGGELADRWGACWIGECRPLGAALRRSRTVFPKNSLRFLLTQGSLTDISREVRLAGSSRLGVFSHLFDGYGLLM